MHPKSWLGRALVGRFLGSTQVLRLAEKFRALLSSDRPTITLDVFVPFSRVDEFLAWYRREFDFFPLWCVPYRRVRDYEWLSPRFWSRFDDSLFLDLAIYGMKQRGAVNMHKAMEDELMRIGGIKTLISHNYYSEQDFSPRASTCRTTQKTPSCTSPGRISSSRSLRRSPTARSTRSKRSAESWWSTKGRASKSGPKSTRRRPGVRSPSTRAATPCERAR